jgi:hypothetical protein
MPCMPFMRNDMLFGLAKLNALCAEGTHQLRIVGNDSERGAVITQLRQQIDHFAPRLKILAIGRFIKQHYTRLGGEDAADGKTSFLAAGQREGIRLGQMIQAQPRKQLIDKAVRVRFGNSLQFGSESKLFAHARHEELVLRFLQHHADAAHQVVRLPAPGLQSSKTVRNKMR